MSSREINIYMARIYINQARASRRHSNWHAVLLGWAANNRLLAMRKIGQMELFA